MNRFVITAITGILTIPAFSIDVPTASAQRTISLATSRDRMLQAVAQQGVTNQRVLNALKVTPRHKFVPASQRKNAWYDMALPIGNGQTISPPFVVANMTQHIDPQPSDRVLEIGTGSGYQAAVLSPLVKDVYSIEIVEPLGRRAALTLNELGYENVHTRIGDGFLGWEEHAPFDKIIVTCSPEKIPQPLIDQLRDGGKMVIPLGERFQQTLYLYKKADGRLQEQAIEPTFFVPMTGKAEDIREIKPDTGIPKLKNGGFEQKAFATLPDGWYYIRDGKVEPDATAPEGQHRLTFTNDVPGHWAQALQAIDADGRKVSELEITLWVRGRDVQPSPSRKHRLHGAVNFFNENRAPVGVEQIGPWNGTFEWVKKKTRIKVPSTARFSVFALGLCGSTGEISFDGVEITVVKEGIEPSSTQ